MVRAFIIACMAAVMGGCAGLGEQHDDPDDSQGLQLLNNIAGAMPGLYSNHGQWREDDRPDPGPYELLVEPRPVDDPGRIEFLLSQTDARDRTRQFRLELAAAPAGHRLQGVLTPIDPSGQARGQCRMNFTVSNRGFSGETNPEDCFFGDGDDAVGLLKEIAFDGQQVVIADRLTRLYTGDPAGEDQIYRFYRVREFSGWAGTRNDGQWRISNEVVLHSEGSETRPADSAGNSLGLNIQLARINWREDQPPILRLSVHDEVTGELIGYAWADEDAEQVGLNLPDVQVGLRLAEPR